MEHVDLYGRLVVGSRGVDLGLARRDGGVAVYHLGHDAAHGLDAQAQRGYVEQQDALDVARKDAALHCRAVGHDLVGVHGHVGLLAGDGLYQVLHGGHTAGAADEDDLVDLGDGDAGIMQGLGNGTLAAVEKVARDALELGTRKRVVKVLGAGCVSGDERQVHLCLLGAGELLLCVLGGLLEALQSHGIAAKVDAVVLLELVGKPIDDLLVPVVAAQVVVAVGGKNLHHAVGKVEQRDVKGATAEVEHQDLLVDVLLVEAICQSCGRGLVDDALHVEARDLAGVLGGLTLGVVEVGGNGDDGVGDGLAQVLLGVGLHLGENHCADLLRGEVLTVDLDHGAAASAGLDAIGNGLELGAHLVIATAHEALDGEYSVCGVGDGLVLCSLADDAVAVRTESDDGRGRTIALSVDDNRGLAALEDCHSRVGGAKVDSKNLCHNVRSFRWVPVSLPAHMLDITYYSPAH